MGQLRGDAAQPDAGSTGYVCDAGARGEGGEDGGVEVVVEGVVPEVVLIVEARGCAMIAGEGVSVLPCGCGRGGLGWHFLGYGGQRLGRGEGADNGPRRRKRGLERACAKRILRHTVKWGVDQLPSFAWYDQTLRVRSLVRRSSRSFVVV